MAAEEQMAEGTEESLPKAFVIPASNADARNNLKKTIYSKVPLSQIESLPKAVRNLAEATSADDGFNAWGCQQNKKGTWEKLSPGDLCLFYSAGMFVTMGRVAGKIESSPLGKNLWGDKVWEYCYFLTEVEEVAIPSSVGFQTLGYGSGYRTPLGFNIVNRQDGSQQPFRVTPEVLAQLKAANGSTKPAVDKAVAVIAATPQPPQDEGEQDDQQIFDTVNDLDSAGVDLSDEALKEQLAKAGSLTPEQETALVKRFRRCQKLARKVKEIYGGKCQVCGFTFEKKKSGEPYAEAAHIVALGDGGPDQLQNLLCLCPNHHKMLDHGGLEIRWNQDLARLEALSPLAEPSDSSFQPIANKHILG